MKKKKLDLQNLEVQSFVTSVNSDDVKGGADLTLVIRTTTPCYGTFHACNIPSVPVYTCNIPSVDAACPTLPVGACVATDTCGAV